MTGGVIMKQYNTAICFSGELRTYNVAMPWLLEYFSDFPSRYILFILGVQLRQVTQTSHFEILRHT